jgi:hypothetical protein
MSELRLHGISLQAGPRQLRIHGIQLVADQVPVQRELRIHSIALTSSDVPPISDGGWWVYVGGEWVEYEALFWDGTQWI